MMIDRKMLTFPHMGPLNIFAKTFFNELGFDVIEPPPVSQKTLDLGVKYAPEFACLPFKINLGNFIEALEKGANIIIMGGGCGPCRFGYYGEVQQEILKELGYDFEMFMIEPSLMYNIRNIRNIFGGISMKKLISAVKLTWRKIDALDSVHALVLKKRAVEKNVGEVDNLYDDFLKDIKRIKSITGVSRIKKEYLQMIENCESDYKFDIPVYIGLVGEIYMLIEPSVNLNIEKKLGELGAVVERHITIKSWLEHFLHLTHEMNDIKEAAYRYLQSEVGGHGLNTIGDTVRFSNKGFDGVVQVGPFTCMPEIVSRAILPEVSKGEEIPVLSLFFDEHTGDAGLQTRIEAFVDLLRRKKEMQEAVI